MAVDPRHKALLAELAYGDDPSVSAETRLRASEALAALSDATGNDLSERLIREMAALSEQELDSTYIDPELADVVVTLCGPVPGHPEDDDPMPLAKAESHFPQAAEAVRYHIERRAGEIAAAGQAGLEADAWATPVEVTPTAEASEALNPQPVEEMPTELAAEAPAPTADRSGREPYHGWPCRRGSA
jgi:hypothetical protein